MTDAAHAPERVLPEHLILLKIGAAPPALVVRERMSIFLEQRVDAGDAPVPGVLEVLQRQAAVLGVGLLALQRVLGPHSLGIDELALPGLHVAEQVRNNLIFFMRHAAPEVRHALVRLFGIAQVLRVERHCCETL